MFDDRRSRGWNSARRDFLPINIHGKCSFSPLNHIAGRVKIVLGKKKTDKHTVWASGEAVQHPVYQSWSLRSAYVHRYMEYVPRDGGIFRRILSGWKRVFSYENAETWRHRGYLEGAFGRRRSAGTGGAGERGGVNFRNLPSKIGGAARFLSIKTWSPSKTRRISVEAEAISWGWFHPHATPPIA